jgi:hypothetical protein
MVEYINKWDFTVLAFQAPVIMVCNNGNQYAAQFPEGIRVIINYEAMEVINPNDSECSNKVAQYESGGHGVNQQPVYASQQTELYGHLHMSSNFDFMTDN